MNSKGSVLPFRSLSMIRKCEPCDFAGSHLGTMEGRLIAGCLKPHRDPLYPSIMPTNVYSVLNILYKLSTLPIPRAYHPFISTTVFLKLHFTKKEMGLLISMDLRVKSHSK
jgi:hypothetical protein